MSRTNHSSHWSSSIDVFFLWYCEAFPFSFIPFVTNCCYPRMKINSSVFGQIHWYYSLWIYSKANLHYPHLSPTNRKYVFTEFVDSEDPDETARAQSDQGLHCPLTESFDSIECVNGGQMPGWDLAHPGICPPPTHSIDTFSLDVAHVLVLSCCSSLSKGNWNCIAGESSEHYFDMFQTSGNIFLSAVGTW